MIEPIYREETSDSCDYGICPRQVRLFDRSAERLVVKLQVLVCCEQVFDVCEFGSGDFTDRDDTVPLQDRLICKFEETLMPLSTRVEQYGHFQMMPEQSDE